MGGQQSKAPRTISFDNESPDDIISISQDVVNRLKNQKANLEGGKSDDAKTTRGTDSSASTPKAAAPPPPSSAFAPSSSPAQKSMMRRPAFLQHAEPSLTTMQVRQEKEAELRANDEYWRNRVHQTEVTLNKTNAVMEKEYEDTVKSVKSMFQNAPVSYQSAPCQEFRARLIACYKAFPNQTLNCQQEVKDFLTCVDTSRVELLDAKHATPSAAQ